MAGLATKAVSLSLRRRMIGSLIVIAGVLIVLVGFFADLESTDVGSGLRIPGLGTSLSQQSVQGLADSLHAGLSGGSGTAASILRHAHDHGLTNVTRVSTVADLATRLGVVLMAAGGLLALLLLFTPMRGFIGLAAGLGLLGLAMVAGVIAGTNTQLSSVVSGAIHLSVGHGVIICALGFGVILVGGALAALRPMAGVVSGISLALVGAGAGAALALAVGGDHFASGLP